MSHWLDETAEALATGRTTRRQVLLRGGLVAAAAMFGSATRPGFGLGARAKTPALFCPDLPCPDLAPDCCGEVRCYDSNAGYRCCNSAVYHREEEGCCDGKLYQLERESCCTSGEICSTTGRIGESCCDDSCCLDGTCCEGQCIGFSSDEGCCHGKRYDPNAHRAARAARSVPPPEGSASPAATTAAASMGLAVTAHARPPAHANQETRLSSGVTPRSQAPAIARLTPSVASLVFAHLKRNAAAYAPVVYRMTKTCVASATA